MSTMEKISTIKNAVDAALDIYPAENLDLVRDEANNVFRVMYHSRHNSFMVDDNFAVPFDGNTATSIIPELDKRAVGYCW